MTNSCLVISPIPKALTDAIQDLLAASAAAPEAVSLWEMDEALGIWEISAYFASVESARKAAELVGELGIRPDQIVIQSLPDEDWVRFALKELSPVRAGPFLVHGSHDQRARRPHGVNLEIDAGLAFGTGHHGTTLGCLLAFDAALRTHHRPRVLDLGCGSAILAIAAAKRCKVRVLACDIDPVAVTIAHANAQVNEAGPFIKTLVADGPGAPYIAASGPFDIIFANILARPLARFARSLSFLVARNGALILSGITREQERWIGAAYRRFDLVVSSRIHIGEWSTLTLRRAAITNHPVGNATGRRCEKGS